MSSNERGDFGTFHYFLYDIGIYCTFWSAKFLVKLWPRFVGSRIKQCNNFSNTWRLSKISVSSASVPLLFRIRPDSEGIDSGSDRIRHGKKCKQHLRQ